LKTVNDTAPGRRRFKVKTGANQAPVFSTEGETEIQCAPYITVYEHVCQDRE